MVQNLNGEKIEEEVQEVDQEEEKENKGQVFLKDGQSTNKRI